jgi:hypothetical protein
MQKMVPSVHINSTEMRQLQPNDFCENVVPMEIIIPAKLSCFMAI